MRYISLTLVAASLKRASEVKRLFTAVHCGRAQSEMRDELFTLRQNYSIIRSTYLPLPFVIYRLVGV